MRVHELAKELGVTSKELVARLKEMGAEVKSHMSQVEESFVKKAKAAFSGNATETKVESKPEKKTAKKSQEEKPKATKQEPKPAAKPEPKVEKAPEPPVEEEVEELIEEEAPEETPAEPDAPAKRQVSVKLPITVGGLADVTGESVPKLIKSLMSIGIFANVNQLLTEDVVMSISELMDVEVVRLQDEDELQLEAQEEDESALIIRPPVVTMMGHVDHGKTTLLDTIRKTNVAAREKGAITQHVGAYSVDIPGKGLVTFLDTPGHEAFTAMRARGANVTDVVVLVVAADDGVMPQTVEAIDHAREANCPIVVAINKCDLPSADMKKVMLGLQQQSLTPEAVGGNTICVEVSGKTGKGIDQLLELLLLEAEILELKANPKCEASGTIIEAHLSKGSGPVATVIVQRGTLRVGDMVVCSEFMGRVRAMKNDAGKTMKEAGPSMAVTLMGLAGVPEAGDKFVVINDERAARRVTEKRALEKREIELSGAASKHLSLETLYERISEGNFKELKIIIKADVQGSMEALAQSLEKASNDQCQVRVIHRGIGGINESDVMLAAASDAVIIGFHVKADTKAEKAAKKEGVNLRYYHIIYEAVDEVRNAMEGLLEPTYEESIEGRIEIRKIFKSSKAGNIGGGYVIKGKVVRNNPVRLIRDNVVIFEGSLSALKRFKDDVRDVAQGYECGVSLVGHQDLREGDIVESYRMNKVATKLE